MAHKFIYNNNHTYHPELVHGGKRKIIKRDFSGHWGIVCNRCGKEILGNPLYSIKWREGEIVTERMGEIHIKKLPKKTKVKDVLIELIITKGKDSHHCGQCVGIMEDAMQKMNHRRNKP